MRRLPEFRPWLGVLVLLPMLALAEAMPAASTTAADEPPLLQVSVGGQVGQAGEQQWPVGTRLSEAVLHADVLPDAYVSGAAWLRTGLLAEQAGNKDFLLATLAQAAQGAQEKGKAELAGWLLQRRAGWQALPVTGRATLTLLDPRPLEIADRNPLLAAGDRIIYPQRPVDVRVSGAVQAECRLPFVGMATARHYLAGCAAGRFADRDWIYVIQPDGRVTKEGVALWNRDEQQPLAPGAVIYVPLDPRWLPKAARASFNDKAAAFLATQVPAPSTREAQP